MRIGVLALQGAFAEHIQKLQALDAEVFEIRQRNDISEDFDGLVLPGGESTVMKKLLSEFDLLAPLREMIQNGLPTLATCAGMILLAKEIEGGEDGCFQTMDMTVRRNAYGRQLGSFRCMEQFDGRPIEMPFIRAPYVTNVGNDVQVLAEHDGNIVAVRQRNQLALAFHPELTEDDTVYQMFLQMIREWT